MMYDLGPYLEFNFAVLFVAVKIAVNSFASFINLFASAPGLIWASSIISSQ